MSKLPAPIAKRLTPAENEMFWLPTPGEVWSKSVDLYKNGYRNARDINPYPWIVDTYAAPWPLFKDKAPAFIPNAAELNEPWLKDGAEITDNDGNVITKWMVLKTTDPVSYRHVNKGDEGELLAGQDRNYNFFANGMPILRGHLQLELLWRFQSLLEVSLIQSLNSIDQSLHSHGRHSLLLFLVLVKEVKFSFSSWRHFRLW